MITQEEMQVARGARRLLAKIYEKLNAQYPDGDYSSCPYFKLELKDYIRVLENLANHRQSFGKYLIRNGYEGSRLGNVGTDLFLDLCNFIVNGPANPGQDWKSAENLSKRDLYVSGYETDEFIRFEHLAIHEVIGTYIKKIRPGIEKHYYRLE